jgi:hypothetical protein
MTKPKTLKKNNSADKGTREISLQGGKVIRRDGTLDPKEILKLEFYPLELDKIMNYLIETNAGVQVFLLIDRKIQEAKKRRDESLTKEPKPGVNGGGDNGSKH